MSTRFTVEFYNEAAEREYMKLDGSIRKLIDVGLRKLEVRADEIGKPLHGELSGCKELKYRKDGIRIIFRVNNGIVELVEIIAIGNRRQEEVFHDAAKRLASSN